MQKEHHYQVAIEWTGNNGEGTKKYTGYERSHRVTVAGKPAIEASSDPSFRGDVTKYNPEELFVSSIAACHMLWYLHLCADNGIVVESYTDEAIGTMLESVSGGRFVEVLLNPVVKITDYDKQEMALALHDAANTYCFIANSCNFPVIHKPVCICD